MSSAARRRFGVKTTAAILNTNPGVISRCAGRGARKRVEDPDFRKSYEDLDRALAEDQKQERSEGTS
jgi:hypothetical protein